MEENAAFCGHLFHSRCGTRSSLPSNDYFRMTHTKKKKKRVMTSTRFFSVSVLVAKLAKNNYFQMGTFTTNLSPSKLQIHQTSILQVQFVSDCKF